MADRRNPLSRPGPGTLIAELSVLKPPITANLGSRSAREYQSPTHRKLTKCDDRICPECGNGGLFRAHNGGVVCDGCGCVYYWRTESPAPRKKAKAISSRQWAEGAKRGRC